MVGAISLLGENRSTIVMGWARRGVPGAGVPGVGGWATTTVGWVGGSGGREPIMGGGGWGRAKMAHFRGQKRLVFGVKN